MRKRPLQAKPHGAIVGRRQLLGRGHQRIGKADASGKAADAGDDVLGRLPLEGPVTRQPLLVALVGLPPEATWANVRLSNPEPAQHLHDGAWIVRDQILIADRQRRNSVVVEVALPTPVIGYEGALIRAMAWGLKFGSASLLPRPRRAGESTTSASSMIHHWPVLEAS
jgi:hypothetical protein